MVVIRVKEYRTASASVICLCRPFLLVEAHRSPDTTTYGEYSVLCYRPQEKGPLDILDIVTVKQFILMYSISV